MGVEKYMTSNEMSLHYQTTKLNTHHGWIIDLLAEKQLKLCRQVKVWWTATLIGLGN